MFVLLLCCCCCVSLLEEEERLQEGMENTQNVVEVKVYYNREYDDMSTLAILSNVKNASDNDISAGNQNMEHNDVPYSTAYNLNVCGYFL